MKNDTQKLIKIRSRFGQLKSNVESQIAEILADLDTFIRQAPIEEGDGKPPRPRYSSRVKWSLWKIWDKLRAREFTAREAKELACIETPLVGKWTDSSFSAVLAEWAAEGYLERTAEGKGPVPAKYRIFYRGPLASK